MVNVLRSVSVVEETRGTGKDILPLLLSNDQVPGEQKGITEREGWRQDIVSLE